MRYFQCKYCGSRNQVFYTHCHRCHRGLPLGVLKKALVVSIIIVALVLVASSVYPVFR